MGPEYLPVAHDPAKFPEPVLSKCDFRNSQILDHVVHEN